MFKTKSLKSITFKIISKELTKNFRKNSKKHKIINNELKKEIQKEYNIIKTQFLILKITMLTSKIIDSKLCP